MINLLMETRLALEERGKTFNDVLWIGDRSGASQISIHDFYMVANRDYSNGFGSNYVNLNLVIVGSDWWIERAEYDGSEWWEFKTLPTLSPDCDAEISAKRLIWGEV